MLIKRFLLTDNTKAFFDKVIKENNVVVFMKGTASAPQCGFSANVCQILQRQGLSKFTTVNVLEEDELRNGIKEYS